MTRPPAGTRLELGAGVAVTVLEDGGIFLHAEGLAEPSRREHARVSVHVDAAHLLHLAAGLAALTGEPFFVGPYCDEPTFRNPQNVNGDEAAWQGPIDAAGERSQLEKD